MATELFCSTVRDWFTAQFGVPTLVQEKAWPKLAAGGAAVVAAPTGAGKTLAAFMPFIDQLVREFQAGTLSTGVRVVYISPLKALSNDIKKNLAQPLDAINARIRSHVGEVGPLKVALRTGDTTPAERARILKHPPHILVTTPESLYLMLTSERARGVLASTTTVIVDEIHTLARDKRGSHLTLSLERLEHLCGRPLQRIGLSATAKPLGRIADFLTGSRPSSIVDASGPRNWDLKIETPDTPLSAICSYEMWEEVYHKLVALIQEHRSTLIFVNTRYLAERLAHQLGEIIGGGVVMSHHGSMSKEHRLDAEDRLKRGELKAIVATASLELGIDIGAIDLVCQIGSPRSIAAFLQRVGRSGHSLDRTPKGRIFALTRDELLESMALVRAIGKGIMDAVEIIKAPLDILAQQIVAAVAVEDWHEDDLFALFRRAWPYLELSRAAFDSVVKILAEGMAPGIKRGAYLHHDRIHGLLKARRSARLTAVTSGGAIPEQNLYRVVIEGEGTLVGTIDEDFAIEASRGDIFQLGNTAWLMLGIRGGNVMVRDASGAPPTIPFWRGEAPGRTFELSGEVSNLRSYMATNASDIRVMLIADCGLAERDADQALSYVEAEKAALGVIPTQSEVVWERFFDDAGGMQLVIHAPFGTRVNRAWGLALRKRFCRSFDFELQASADDDGIVMSVGPNQGFALDSLFNLLKSDSAQSILVQALLDAPMFGVRWRWNVTRALAVLRFRGGKQVPPAMQRFHSGDLLTAVFPQQTQCFEHRTGDLELPDHPLVQQTVTDCLTEAMDTERWLEVLKSHEEGRIKFIARDSREPSPFCYERLNANPYAFLDDAPLEERRARAVGMRRIVSADDVRELGRLSRTAIVKVRNEAWPLIRDGEEMHEALIEMVLMTNDEAAPHTALVEKLVTAGRAVRVAGMVAATQEWPVIRALFPAAAATMSVTLPAQLERSVEREDAIMALVRGRLEVEGPLTASGLSERFGIAVAHMNAALLVLESRGIALSGHYEGSETEELEWCERRLLARIHRLTIDGLREEIKPLPADAYIRFLCRYQRLTAATSLIGESGARAVLEQLAGYEIPAGAWESEILTARIKNFQSPMLDHWLMTGEFVWGRLTAPDQDPGQGRFRGWSRDMPFALSPRHQIGWILPEERAPTELEEGPARRVEAALRQGGALYFQDIVRLTGLLPTQVHEALGRMAHLGLVASDNLSGLRPFFGPDRRVARELGRDRRVGTGAMGLAAGGRWFLFPPLVDALDPGQRVEEWAWLLLKRWGVMFADLLVKERLAPPWRDLVRVFRKLEARGQIRGGRYVRGVGGEQFALPGVIADLRAVAEIQDPGEAIVLAACDPVNLFGVITEDIRVPATRGNRIVIRDGKMIAYRIGGRLEFVPGVNPADHDMLARSVRLSGVFRRQDPFLQEWKSHTRSPSPAIDQDKPQQRSLKLLKWSTSLGVR